jgi:hypothetical protein
MIGRPLYKALGSVPVQTDLVGVISALSQLQINIIWMPP